MGWSHTLALLVLKRERSLAADLSTAQMTVVVFDLATTITEAIQAGVAPISVALLAGGIQPVAINADVAARLFIGTPRHSAAPAVPVPAAGAAEAAVIIHDGALAIAIIERGITPLAARTCRAAFESPLCAVLRDTRVPASRIANSAYMAKLRIGSPSYAESLDF